MERRNSDNMLGDQNIIWLSDLHSLSDIIDNFTPPVLVKVVDGYMLTDENCLESETILTIHGQITMKKIFATDQLGKDLDIPIVCKYKLHMRPYSEMQVFKTIKDVCEIPYLPACVENKKEFKFHGTKFPASTKFQVQSICNGPDNKPKGLSVISLGPSPLRITLPLSTRGDFMTVTLPCDRNREYVIADILDRKLPTFVEFLPTNEENPVYSPRQGVVKLKEIKEANIIYATNYIDNKRHIVTFSRDLDVKLKIGRVLVEEYDQTYSTIAEPKEEPVDDLILHYLLHSDPYLGDYNTAIYSELQGKVNVAACKIENESSGNKPPVPDRSFRKSIRKSGVFKSMDMNSETNICQTKGEHQDIKALGLCRTDRNSYEEIKRTDDAMQADLYAEIDVQKLFQPVIQRTTKNKNSVFEAFPYEDMKNRYTPEPVAPPRPSPRITRQIIPGPIPNPCSAGAEEKTNIERNISTESKAIVGSATNLTNKNCIQDKTIMGNSTVNQSKENSQLKEGMSDALVKVIALSLPLDEAATLHYEQNDDVAKKVEHTTAVRPKLPPPLRKKPMRTASKSTEISSGKVKCPPAVPVRSDLAPSTVKVELEQSSQCKEAPENTNEGHTPRERFQSSGKHAAGSRISRLMEDESLSEAVLEEIQDKNEDEVCEMLSKLNLSDFANDFKAHQIDGSLLADIEEDDLVNDINMSQFQARKLWLYIRGWKIDAEISAGNQIRDDNLYSNWTVAEVDTKLRSINLSSFAKFCLEHQVNGALLGNILDKEVLQSIREKHQVEMSGIEERKLCKFVLCGWRPSTKQK